MKAFYIIGIAKAHTFPDGNKRTSFLSATYFLDMNGYVLKENSELPDIIEQAASGSLVGADFNTVPHLSHQGIFIPF